MTVISYIYNNKFFSFMTTDITHTQVAGGGCILGMKNIKLSWKTILGRGDFKRKCAILQKSQRIHLS